MELRHYAAKPATLDRSRTYPQEPPTHSYQKPHGLWVSVLGGYDWATFCRTETFELDRLEVEHVVTLAEGAKVLTIDQHQGLVNFQGEFGTLSDFGRKYIYADQVAIDWPAVAERFDGIVIAPYQWSARLEMRWYYGWDVASGCIWNLDAIESFTVAAPALEKVKR